MPARYKVRLWQQAMATMLRTVDGDEVVVSIAKVESKGIYTAVTQNEYLIVGGVMSSPFAVTHRVTHIFYAMHRAMYLACPYLMHVPALVSANALIGFVAAAAETIASDFALPAVAVHRGPAPSLGPRSGPRLPEPELRRLPPPSR